MKLGSYNLTLTIMKIPFAVIKLAAVAAALVAASTAQATTNSSAPQDWRLVPGQSFNGVAGAMDGVGRLSITTSGGVSLCSGSLLSGGQYMVTSAHCVTDLKSVNVSFGWAGGSVSETRKVLPSGVYVHPKWTGDNVDSGADIALIKLDHAVTDIKGYNLSTSNDVGKEFLLAGYGRSGLGGSTTQPDSGDRLWGHYGYNTYDVDSKTFNQVSDKAVPGFGYDAAFYAPGVTYRSDYDDGTAAHNTLGRIADATGHAWTSGTGLGAREAMGTDGDSGGGEFVWSGKEWLLSGVHEWNLPGDFSCVDYKLTGCDARPTNDFSYGDLSGSTATFSHVAWIRSITAVPEADTSALMFAGLALMGTIARRRRQAA